MKKLKRTKQRAWIVCEQNRKDDYYGKPIIHGIYVNLNRAHKIARQLAKENLFEELEDIKFAKEHLSQSSRIKDKIEYEEYEDRENEIKNLLDRFDKFIHLGDTSSLLSRVGRRKSSWYNKKTFDIILTYVYRYKTKEK